MEETPTKEEEQLERIAPGYVVREKATDERVTLFLYKEGRQADGYELMSVVVTLPRITTWSGPIEGSVGLWSSTRSFSRQFDVTTTAKVLAKLLVRADRLLVKKTKELGPEITKAKRAREEEEREQEQRQARINEARDRRNKALAEWDAKMEEALRWYEGETGRMWVKGKKSTTSFDPLGEVITSRSYGREERGMKYVTLTIGGGPRKGQRYHVPLRDIVRVAVKNEEGRRRYDTVDIPPFPKKEVDAAMREERKALGYTD